jgi:hypothetical protein
LSMQNGVKSGQVYPSHAIWSGANSTQSSLQVGDQIRHLLLRKATTKGRHHPFSGQNYTPKFCICGDGTTWKRFSLKEAVQIGWNLFQREVVVLMTMGTSYGIEVLSCEFRRTECRR